ncbi:peptidase M28 [Clostridium botulinum B str. Osaka05]|uniref:Peptidase M28 n=1 Tax=Clostridium botulinum B str. Osaka05 TaxID=1407017 RepID=A0A0S6U646_CLOBO|nr:MULTISPECIES: M28 family peptidase [Clostridium]MCR1975597.1 M28 family peptidase [Clostridium sporogenes]GAE02660.1 peptidase M28 [Clostridium botulinum B str. Osaka05]
MGTINNVVGIIKGKDSKKAVVISAHPDHIGYQDGKIIRGGLDNTSDMSALIKIDNNLKEKPFDMDIVICAFNGEEEGLA